jgi:hypothetical protein
VPQAGVSLSGGHAARLCSQYDCAAQKSAHLEGTPAPKEEENHTGILTWCKDTSYGERRKVSYHREASG